tara:strand:- start:39 stop:413 length:375 start_codon:yes stop_codon:yes gene_type:complete
MQWIILPTTPPSWMANPSVKQAHLGEQWHFGCAMLTYDIRCVLSPSSSLSFKDLQRWCFTFWLILLLAKLVFDLSCLHYLAVCRNRCPRLQTNQVATNKLNQSLFMLSRCHAVTPKWRLREDKR